MNPQNFYTHPSNLDYEKDVDEVGRELIKQINSTDYLRTTMYCSGHFQDEQDYPWKEGELSLCLVALKGDKAYQKLNEAQNVLRHEMGFSNVRGGFLYLYIDQEDNNKQYLISELLVSYETKEERQKIVHILSEIFI